MKVVGDYLKQQAIQRNQPGGVDADSFARSAFQRYYYSMFLLGRELIRNTHGAVTTDHAALPDMLRRTFRRLLIQDANKLFASGVLTATQYKTITSKSHSRSQTLCERLDSARAIRKVADYEPEVSVVFTESTFSLSGRKISEASNWPYEVEMICVDLRRCWRAVYGI